MTITTVYVTTAAKPNETSWACYYDATLETYLGDVYSVKWMENIDEASFILPHTIRLLITCRMELERA